MAASPAAVTIWAVLNASSASWRRPGAVSAAWICDGDRLTAEQIQLGRDAFGTMDQPIPNIADGTVPGDVILLKWRGVTLQLPRTNNAGAPSYTDGRWWWQVEDPEHPDFRQRRGGIVTYACSPEP